MGPTARIIKKIVEFVRESKLDNPLRRLKNLFLARLYRLFMRKILHGYRSSASFPDTPEMVA